jgi:hypothetical protein
MTAGHRKRSPEDRWSCKQPIRSSCRRLGEPFILREYVATLLCPSLGLITTRPPLRRCPSKTSQPIQLDVYTRDHLNARTLLASAVKNQRDAIRLEPFHSFHPSPDSPSPTHRRGWSKLAPIIRALVNKVLASRLSSNPRAGSGV